MPEANSPQTPLADATPVTADDRPPDRPGPSLGGRLDGVKDLGRLELIALLRADQLQRWQRGQRVPAEVYLQEVPTLRDDPELAIDLIFSEFVLRRDVLGEAPSLDEYVARFPQHAIALRHQHELEALWLEPARTQGGPGPAPLTATPPPGASDWTVLEAGRDVTAAAPGVPSLPGYEVLGELGRGGMGLVLKGHDLHLGRDLAIKLLRQEFQDQAHLVRRFLNEARVCGRLQHPGIVPIYELGSLPDRRPFFTMKLVEGRTLADLLDERADPAQDWPRLLTICEQVCQTLAYAHSKGVIHRDLKPENIMVGAFGEVQVMDWGLAKILSRGGDDPPAPAPAGADRWLLTQSGGALGTLPYMPPEQARGEVERMDERCDVFGLGAILCEVLTGRPPFAGRDGAELLARAKACDHGEALSRLEACSAGAELVRLAKGCLAPEPCERPRDAGVLAKALAAYLAGVQERLRGAEVEKAAAQARAAEARATVAAERRARRRAAWLAVAVLLLALLGGGGGLWWERQREEKGWAEAAQAQGANRDLDEVTEFLQTWQLAAAEAAQQRAEGRVANGGPAELSLRVRQMRDALTRVDRLDQIHVSTAAAAGKTFDYASADRDYARVFQEHGLEVEGKGADEAAGRIRGSVIREQLVAALDDWAVATEDRKRRAWLLQVARQAQPGVWSDAFRNPALWDKPAALERLAREADVAQLSPQLLTALGLVLWRNNVDAVPFLKRAHTGHPDDFWLNFLLGNSLAGYGGQGQLIADPEQVIGYYRAALALRPNTYTVHNHLSRALMDKGRVDEALAEARKAIDLSPNYALGHINLGRALYAKGRRDEAAAAFRTAIDLDPELAFAHTNLGVVLMDGGHLEEAIEEHLKAIKLRPNLAMAHNNLGKALHLNGQHDEAIAEFRRAIFLNRKDAGAHRNLGAALKVKKRLDEAITELREAVALQPRDAGARHNFGCALYEKGLLDEAIAELRQAVALQPGSGETHAALGAALQVKGRLDEAVKECRQAIALDLQLARAHGTLGAALLGLGRVIEASDATRRCLDLLPDKDPERPVAQGQLAKCERVLVLKAKLPAILRGDEQPADARERADLALVCLVYEHRAAASARFFADAFADQPRLREEVGTRHRYNAACAAALAGCGQTEDAKSLPDKVAQALRRQALGWLRADLAAWREKLDGGQPADRARVRQQMQHWLGDADLAGVRDREALIRLPEAERPEWHRLWDDVALLAWPGTAP